MRPNYMNIYHPYPSFAHMVRDLKDMIGQEGYTVCAPGDPRAMSDFTIPVMILCYTLKKKYAQETGLFFDTLVDEFEKAFDEGYHSLSFDRDYLVDYIGIDPRKGSKAVAAIIENLEFIKLIQCTRQPESNDRNPVFIFEITELFSTITSVWPNHQDLSDDENHQEESIDPEQRILH